MKKFWGWQWAPHTTGVLVLFIVYEVLVHTKILDVIVQGRL